MTAPPAFDPAAFGGHPEAPQVPMVICWEELDATSHATTLDELTQWLGWLRRTYRIPATVFPPCWYAHPGIREELGHLWTGWLVTRHPDAGVGMIGLDWDARREQTTGRLREATAITGCTASQHRDEQPISGESDTGLLHEYAAQQMQARSREELRRSAIEAVTDRLQHAELRHDLAPQILAEITEHPEDATDQDLAAVTTELHRLAADAPRESMTVARDAVRAVADLQETAGLETRVAATRHTLATAITDGALADSPTGDRTDQETQAWLDAVESLLPANLAAGRAAAIAAARSAAADRRVATHRHPDVARLLAASDHDQDQSAVEGDPA